MPKFKDFTDRIEAVKGVQSKKKTDLSRYLTQQVCGEVDSSGYDKGRVDPFANRTQDTTKLSRDSMRPAKTEMYPRGQTQYRPRFTYVPAMDRIRQLGLLEDEDLSLDHSQQVEVQVEHDQGQTSEVPQAESQNEGKNSNDDAKKDFINKVIISSQDLESIRGCKNSSRGQTSDGYTHLLPQVEKIRGYHLYNNYTYQQASSAYDKIKTAFEDGTYNNPVKKRCTKLGFPFALS